MSFTDSDVAVLSRSSNTAGNTSASVSVNVSRRSWVNSFRIWASTRVIADTLFLFFRRLSFGLHLLDHCDEHIFERARFLVGVEDPEAAHRQSAGDVSNRRLWIGVDDDVQPIAKERHSPALHIGPEDVARALRMFHDDFEDASFLSRLQLRRGPF